MTWMQRMKSGLRRVGDWVTGHDVTVTGPTPNAELLADRPTARPAADVLENEHEVMLVLDVPGADPASTEVQVDGPRLTVMARVAPPPSGMLLGGRGLEADWYAAFWLGDDVESDQVHAALRDGVLTVWLPKRARPRARHIEVHAS